MLRFADLDMDQWLVERARDVAQALLTTQPTVADAHLARWLGAKEDYLRV
jgi:ATP-dependent DNA helicase RecG